MEVKIISEDKIRIKCEIPVFINGNFIKTYKSNICYLKSGDVYYCLNQLKLKRRFSQDFSIKMKSIKFKYESIILNDIKFYQMCKIQLSDKIWERNYKLNILL